METGNRSFRFCYNLFSKFATLPIRNNAPAAYMRKAKSTQISTMPEETSTILKTTLLWVFRIIAAGIFLQTLYFKFTAAPESVFIFENVGMEPWGRIGSGIIELIAGLLLLWPKKSWLGAAIGLVTISGAIFFHITTLGIEVQGDGGTLFYMALIVFASCSGILVLQRQRITQKVKNLFSN